MINSVLRIVLFLLAEPHRRPLSILERRSEPIAVAEPAPVLMLARRAVRARA